jgi:hypothetical protein
MSIEFLCMGNDKLRAVRTAYSILLFSRSTFYAGILSTLFRVFPPRYNTIMFPFYTYIPCSLSSCFFYDILLSIAMTRMSWRTRRLLRTTRSTRRSSTSSWSGRECAAREPTRTERRSQLSKAQNAAL